MDSSNTKKKLLCVTIASLTERGGRVSHCSSGARVAGLELALVGDTVTYEDGSEAVITDGAGRIFVNTGEGTPHGPRSFALVGSGLSNGDHIVETLQDKLGYEIEEGEHIEGLFDPAYVPPAPEPRYRLATRGATSARGGVLREVTSGYKVSTAIGEAATLGDLVHYPDGSTSRIVSGIGIANSETFKPLAIVGSELENGDTITHSRDRDGAFSQSSFIVVKRTDFEPKA